MRPRAHRPAAQLRRPRGILAGVTRTPVSSSHAPARRSSKHGLAAATLASFVSLVMLADVGCKSGGNRAGSDDPALAAIQTRMPPLATTEIGPTPGFLAGGTVFLALRPGKAQRWLQALPLGPDVVRDIARAGNDLGFDPRVDDVAARLGIDPDAVISATLFRPLTTHAPTVRGLLQRGTVLPDPFPGLGATPSDMGPLPRDLERRSPPIPPPQPIPSPEPTPSPVFVPIAPQPIIPPPQPVQQKPTSEQGELARKAGTLGSHHRIHVPMRDVSLLLAPLRRVAERDVGKPEVQSLCAQLGPSDLCFGGSRELILVRSADKTVAIDFFNFSAGTGTASDPERLPVIKEALAAPVSTLAPLATLRGDFAAFVDADTFTAVQEVESLAGAASALHWSPQSTAARLTEAANFAALRETRRLFAGARLEVILDADSLQSTFQWEPRDDASREVLTRLFTRKPAAASVPTLSGLCDGSLACMRTAGLPSPASFDELAVGVYARPENELERILDDADDFAALAVFFETWPNLLGAAQRWPREQNGRIENVMIGQALEAVGRIEGMGGSLRSIHVNRGNVSGDFVGYMRLQGQDLALIRSLMSLAGVSLAPVTLPQIAGKVEGAAIPDSDVPASLLLITDPGTVRAGDRDIEVGWAVVADNNDRLGWMYGLERSAAVLPAFYFELPDLWQLIATTGGQAPRELGFAQSWLTGRSLRIAGDIIDGRLRIDMQLARTAAAAAAPPAVAK